MKKFVYLICLFLIVSIIIPNNVFANTGNTVSSETIDGYNTTEAMVQEKLESQLTNINNQLQTMGKYGVQLNNTGIQSLEAELKGYNLDELIYSDLIEERESIEEYALQERDTLSFTTQSEVINENQVFSMELEEDIIEDVVYDYDEIDIANTPEAELIDVEVTLNIVRSSDFESFDLDTFNSGLKDEVYLKENPVTNPYPIGLDPVVPPKLMSVSPSLSSTTESSSNDVHTQALGFFVTVHNTWSINQKTKNAKIVTQASVVLSGGKIRPKKYTIALSHANATLKSGYYTTVKSATYYNVGILQKRKIESSITKTYFWRGNSKVTGIFTDGQSKTEKKSADLLLNKKGVPYPYYKDGKSGKVMSQPASTLWPENRIATWTTTKRKAYRDWYDSKYEKLNWDLYEIHHIRPLAYSGTNDYSNLIPLPKSFHQKKVTPWWTNY